MTTAAATAPVFPRQVVGTWTLASSMLHGGDETLGTTRLFRTKGIIYEGRVVQIPTVSGNAIRGLWRRACAIAFLDAYLAAGGRPVSLSAFYYLTSGGALKKGADAGALDLSAERSLRDLIPYVGLFGGAGLGKIQAGKLWVDEAVPICRETVPILRRMWPAVEDAPTAQLSVRELIELHGYSRQDDAKNDHWHRYLSKEGKAEATALVKRVQESDAAAEAGAAQQMRYENVELMAGTVLFHRWGFSWPPTRQELAGLGAGLLAWAERPHAGGRNAVGHGNLLLDYQGIGVETKLLGDGSAPLAELEDRGAAEVLADHVREHIADISAVLAAL